MRLDSYDFQDMYDDVIKFNVLAKGIDPVYSPVSDQFYERLKLQLKLLDDEVYELEEAISLKDNPEVLKEAIDCGVVWMGIMGILRSAGFDISQGMEDVCENNISKILDNREYAEASVEFQAKQGVESYIEEVFFEGETYYAIRRKSDTKILKPENYKKVTLEHCSPVVQ